MYKSKLYRRVFVMIVPTMRKLDLRTEMDIRGLEQPPQVCSLIGSDFK